MRSKSDQKFNTETGTIDASFELASRPRRIRKGFQHFYELKICPAQHVQKLHRPDSAPYYTLHLKRLKSSKSNKNKNQTDKKRA